MKPSPAVAAMLHRNRFKRRLTLSCDIPYVPGKCAWCGGPRGGLKYCCRECRTEAEVRGGGSMVRYIVRARDKGVCAVCGLDAGQWLYRALFPIYKVSVGTDYVHYWNPPAWAIAQWGPWWSAMRGRQTLWDVDHIIPVQDGGGCCGLENLRTLCVRCHKEKH